LPKNERFEVKSINFRQKRIGSSAQNVPLKTNTNKPPKFNAMRPHVNYGNNASTFEAQSNQQFIEDHFNHENTVHEQPEQPNIPSNSRNDFFDDEGNQGDLQEYNQEATYNKQEVIYDENPMIVTNNQNHHNNTENERGNQETNPHYHLETNEESSENINKQTLSLIKENSELKISRLKLEKDFELEVERNVLFEKELNELREAHTELKLKFSNINQESHQFELNKLHNKLDIKQKEIELLEKEKAGLKDQLSSYERYFKNVVERHTPENNIRHQVTHPVKV
jgi:hypothetical protein